MEILSGGAVHVLLFGAFLYFFNYRPRFLIRNVFMRKKSKKDQDEAIEQLLAGKARSVSLFIFSFVFVITLIGYI